MWDCGKRYRGRHDVVDRELVGRWETGLSRGSVDLVLEEAHDVIDVRIASGGQTIERRSSKRHGVRAQRQCLDDVGAATTPAVDQNRRGYSRSRLGEIFENRDTGIEVPPPWLDSITRPAPPAIQRSA